MMMLSVMDPAGTESRRKGRLKRRVYHSKVSIPRATVISSRHVYYRDQTLYGIRMDTIN